MGKRIKKKANKLKEKKSKQQNSGFTKKVKRKIKANSKKLIISSIIAISFIVSMIMYAQNIGNVNNLGYKGYKFYVKEIKLQNGQKIKVLALEYKKRELYFLSHPKEIYFPEQLKNSTLKNKKITFVIDENTLNLSELRDDIFAINFAVEQLAKAYEYAKGYIYLGSTKNDSLLGLQKIDCDAKYIDFSPIIMITKTNTSYWKNDFCYVVDRKDLNQIISLSTGAVYYLLGIMK